MGTTRTSGLLPGSDQVSGEPGEGVVPGGDRLLLVVARAGVVVEGVLGAGIDLDLIGDAGGLERSLEVIPALVGEIARIVGIDAENGGFDIRNLIEWWWWTVVRDGCLEPGLLGCGAPGNAAAEAEADHPDTLGEWIALLLVEGDRVHEGLDMPVDVAAGQDVGDGVWIADGSGAALRAEQIDRAGDIAHLGETAGDIADVIGQAAVLVADEDEAGAVAGGRGLGEALGNRRGA